MPLNHGYSVGIGTFVNFYRDQPNNFGQYFHGHVIIRIGNQDFEAAVDVNKPDGGIQYFAPTSLNMEKFATINALPDGLHSLASNSTSGALDYKRNDLISVPLGCLAIFFGILHLINKDEMRQPWTENVGTIALDRLEAMFADPASIAKVYLFGEPFTQGFGVHNVHCNQGDPLPTAPVGTQAYNQQLGWYNAGGIWQDGGVIVKYNDNRLAGFFVKFTTQTLNTGNDGHPL